jgi:heme-degrading monooxygenase HmoA
MSICLIINVPGATQEQYDAVVQGVGEPELADGNTHHVAGPADGGWCVVDVWESRAHFDRFLQERLGEQLQRAGLAQPEIREFPVHREVHG